MRDKRVDYKRLQGDRERLLQLLDDLEWYIVYHVTPSTEAEAKQLLKIVQRKLTYNDKALKAFAEALEKRPPLYDSSTWPDTMPG